MASRFRWRAVLAGALVLAVAAALNPWTLGRHWSPDGVIESKLIIGAIITMQIVLAVAGLLLLSFRPQIGAKTVLATVIACGACLLGVELAVRWIYAQDDLMYATARRSEVLGWETRSDLHLTRSMGHYGTVKYSTDEYGFRRYGNVASTRPRILVIGDSYTEAAQVSNGGTYYDVLADSAGLPVEVFAYGTGAYGSLQEFLILDRYIDRIRPSLILWQFCSNDLINNYRPLEARSLFENSWRRRPYLEDGAVRMRVPTMRLLPQWSRTAQLLASRSAMVKAARASADPAARQSIESRLSPEHPMVEAASQVTGEIMEMVRERADGVPVVAFSVDRPRWLGSTFEEIAARAGIRYIAGVPELVETHRARGVVVDGITNLHWNARGHAIVGRMLADSLVAMGLVPGKRDMGSAVASR